MKLKAVKQAFEEGLQDLYPSEEIQSFFVLLSEFLLNYSRLDTVLNQSEILSEETITTYGDALKRLQNQEPIQYIIGATEFFSMPLKVNSATLIPRPETEELVQWVLDFAHETDIQVDSLLDIGTGSGCIAIALAKHVPEARVSALDISEEAIKVATENAKQNDVAVNFMHTDILSVTTLPASYACIVSNPPYVRNKEKKQMAPNVLENEPASALYVSDEDPLLFYRKIAQLAKGHLINGGQLFFEINEYLSKEMIALLTSEGYSDVEVRKDMYGKDRMLRGTFKK